MKSTEHNCCATTFPPGMFRGLRCVNRAKFERDGLWFCGQHDPVSKEERRKKRGPTAAEIELARIRERVEFKEKLAAAFLELWPLRPTGAFPPAREEEMRGLVERCRRIVAKKEVPL